MSERYDPETVIDYLEDELSDADRVAFERQLAEDPELAELVRRLGEDRAAMRSLPREAAPPGLAEDAVQNLEREMLLGGDPPPPQDPLTAHHTSIDSAPDRRRRLAFRVAGYAAVAAGILIIGGVLVATLAPPGFLPLTDRSTAFGPVAARDAASSETPETAAPAAEPSAVPQGPASLTSSPPPSDGPAAATATTPAQREADPRSARSGAGEDRLASNLRSTEPAPREERADLDHSLARQTPGGALSSSPLTAQQSAALRSEAEAHRSPDPVDRALVGVLPPASSQLAESSADSPDPDAAAPPPVQLRIQSDAPSRTRDAVLAWARANDLPVFNTATADAPNPDPDPNPARDKNRSASPHYLLIRDPRQLDRLVVYLNTQAGQSAAVAPAPESAPASTPADSAASELSDFVDTQRESSDTPPAESSTDRSPSAPAEPDTQQQLEAFDWDATLAPVLPPTDAPPADASTFQLVPFIIEPTAPDATR